MIAVESSVNAGTYPELLLPAKAHPLGHFRRIAENQRVNLSHTISPNNSGRWRTVECISHLVRTLVLLAEAHKHTFTSSKPNVRTKWLMHSTVLHLPLLL